MADRFNSTQFVTSSMEHEHTNVNWYHRFARHPFYGETGVNTGIMLINLERMRNFGFVPKAIEAFEVYKFNITWWDQDVFNIVMFQHPEIVYRMPCWWNYRPDHCQYSNWLVL